MIYRNPEIILVACVLYIIAVICEHFIHTPKFEFGGSLRIEAECKMSIVKVIVYKWHFSRKLYGEITEDYRKREPDCDTVILELYLNKNARNPYKEVRFDFRNSKEAGE